MSESLLHRWFWKPFGDFVSRLLDVKEPASFAERVQSEVYQIEYLSDPFTHHQNQREQLEQSPASDWRIGGKRLTLFMYNRIGPPLPKAVEHAKHQLNHHQFDLAAKKWLGKQQVRERLATVLPSTRTGPKEIAEIITPPMLELLRTQTPGVSEARLIAFMAIKLARQPEPNL